MPQQVLSAKDEVARNAVEPRDSQPAAYERPALERLGSWSALTLIQTIPISGG